jgi:IS5 family transposase
VLHKTISAMRAETWGEIDPALLSSAAEAQLERGRVVRLDSTVTAALMHEPSDSSLWDAVRVIVRLLREAPALFGRGQVPVACSPSRGEEARPGDRLTRG